MHVALWEAGAGLTAAAVALPTFEQVFATDTVDPNAGSNAGDGSPSPSRRDRPLILVSPTRPPWFAPFVARQIGADLATMGSAGAKAMVVLCGEADAYLHTSGQQEWDSAAPVAVLQAAGFHAPSVLMGRIWFTTSPIPTCRTFSCADRTWPPHSWPRSVGPLPLGGSATREPVAIKFLRSEMGGHSAVRRRFEAEPRMAARLFHPNVVTVFDSGEQATRPFIVMERLPGWT